MRVFVLLRFALMTDTNIENLTEKEHIMEDFFVFSSLGGRIEAFECRKVR